MKRSHPIAFGAALVLAAGGLLAAVSPTRADDTGISATVDAILDLSVEPTDSTHVATTVTTTASRTQLSMSGSGAARVLGQFAGPVTGKRQVVRVEPPKGSGDVTFTLGPQGP